MNIIDGLTFDDLLLIPEHSKISSRSQISVKVDLGKGITLNGPYISANMKTVTGPELAGNMYNYGMGILHRFDTIENQILNYKKALEYERKYITSLNNGVSIGVSVGINSISENDYLIQETGTRIVCIDVAHGDHERVLNEITRLATKYTKVLLIAGNVATWAGAKRLSSAGADVIKVGIGNGSLCSTRIETGNGVPQMTALEQCYNAVKDTNTKVISDGGIKRAGDCVKALCFSHAVMLGSVLAGTDESPGAILTDGRKYKEYAGSSTHKTNRIEGVAGLIPYKGPMHNILEVFKEGLQSGLSYQGCDNLVDLRDNPRFVRLSSAGLKESHPHANLKK